MGMERGLTAPVSKVYQHTGTPAGDANRFAPALMR